MVQVIRKVATIVCWLEMFTLWGFCWGVTTCGGVGDTTRRHVGGEALPGAGLRGVREGDVGE